MSSAEPPTILRAVPMTPITGTTASTANRSIEEEEEQIESGPYPRPSNENTPTAKAIDLNEEEDEEIEVALFDSVERKDKGKGKAMPGDEVLAELSPTKYSSDPLECLESEEDGPAPGPSRLRQATTDSSVIALGGRSSPVRSTYGMSISPSFGIGKGMPTVEIAFMPLQKLSRYHIPPGVQRPTEQSRLALLPDLYQSTSPSVFSEESSVVMETRPRRTTSKTQQPTWRFYSESPRDELDSDEFGGYGTEEPDENEDDLFSEESEGSGVGLRRSGRGINRNGKEGREMAKRIRTRGSKRNSSDLRSSVSESSFYGQYSKRPMPTKTRKSQRGVEEEEDDLSSYDMDSDGEDELDSLSESDDWDSRKKSKGRRKGRKVRKVEEEVDYLGIHRSFCEKCKRGPANVMLAKALARKKNSGKKRRVNEDVVPDEELAEQLAGWLECEKCVISSHWDCVSANQKRAVLDHFLDTEGPKALKRRFVGIDETAPFVCARCTADPRCLVCHEERISSKAKEQRESEDIEMVGASEEAPLFFRCLRCRQACHYEHLKDPADKSGLTLEEKASHYQNPVAKGDAWWCHQCRGWIWAVDLICAWRPLPAHAKEAPREEDDKPQWKADLPREYLVKWVGRGFRHVTWVPHSWIQTQSPAKLRNFLDKGPLLDLITDETLAAKGDEMTSPTIAKVTEEAHRIQGPRSKKRTADEWEGPGPAPEVDAEAAIPVAWSTVDRILDVMLLPPKAVPKRKALAPKRGKRIMSETPSDQSSEQDGISNLHNLPDGLEPSGAFRMDIDEWEEKSRRELSENDVDDVAGMVTCCYIKWDDLQYDQSCWDTPPPITSPLYKPFKRALARYLQARNVSIPVLTQHEASKRDRDAAQAFSPPQEQPAYIVGGKLMPFQLEGVQWLLYKYFKRESCILADDMGLGKTIQIASVLGYLGSEEYKIYPCLVIVPNSTITNWVREFEKWVPHMRVVPFYGEAASRKVINKYELYHKGLQGKPTGLKAHVVLTTYDMITSAEFRTFASIPRWEMLCVDEGQRIKSDSSLIFNRLKQLNTVHRVLLTGTPLNNNLRELFNLLNFLDPEAFRELEDLEARFDELTEKLVQELHEMIKPYILRRIKADVLKLPPKVEIIVPISLTPLQKHVYRGILERNAEILEAIAKARRRKIGPVVQTTQKAIAAANA